MKVSKLVLTIIIMLEVMPELLIMLKLKLVLELELELVLELVLEPKFMSMLQFTLIVQQLIVIKFEELRPKELLKLPKFMLVLILMPLLKLRPVLLLMQ